jgi:hypothetical protein
LTSPGHRPNRWLPHGEVGKGIFTTCQPLCADIEETAGKDLSAGFIAVDAWECIRQPARKKTLLGDSIPVLVENGSPAMNISMVRSRHPRKVNAPSGTDCRSRAGFPDRIGRAPQVLPLPTRVAIQITMSHWAILFTIGSLILIFQKTPSRQSAFLITEYFLFILILMDILTFFC